jgi:membrane protein YqaA with SNARE-associated domain
VRTAAVTFLFTFASAVIPLLNAEVYLAALATQIHPSDALPLAVLSGLGQMVGKVVWYVGSLRSTELPWVRKRMESGRFRESVDTWEQRINGRPSMAAGIMLLSSIVGFPPLLVMGVVAGALRMRMWIFASTILLGRTIQSYVILVGLAATFHLNS